MSITSTATLNDLDFAPAEAPGHSEPAVGPAPTRERDSAFAITSFVLGLASIVSSWTFVAPIVGLILGILALRRQTTDRTLALWGVWMNAAMLALTVLMGIALVTILIIGFAVSAPTWVG